MSTSAPIPPATHSRPGSQSTPNLPFRGDPSEAGREVPTPRAVSARNATTHGLFARDVVLPHLGEDPAAFDALLEQLIAQLPPRNLLERHYLEQIAAASWRLRRLHRWQAQIYENHALTEDQRLDKLDKTLRQENMLTRQIDRAVRLLHRDLSDLFAARARDAALRHYDVTEQDCRNDPHLAADIQRRVWQERDDAGTTPDLHGARLDTQVMPPADTDPALLAPGTTTPSATQKCENEPPPFSASGVPCLEPVNLVHSLAQAPLPFRGGERSLSDGGGTPKLPSLTVTPITPVAADDEECGEYEDPDDYPFVDERYARPDPDPTMGKVCENETEGDSLLHEGAFEENER